MEAHPWKSKFEDKTNHHSREVTEKKVRFRSEYEEIPPPEYASQSGSDDESRHSLPPTPRGVSAAKSAIKKQKISCKNKDGSLGYLSVNGGKVIFAASGNVPKGEHHHWSAHLGEISHLDIEDASKEKHEYSLVFYLNDRTKRVFSEISIDSNAFQILIDDAETLGFVLVVDQLLSKSDDITSSIIAAISGPDVDNFENEAKKKKRSSIISGFVQKNTNRFINDKFNLDLTYITRRMIVMAYPGDGVKGMTWNNAKDVKRFFDTRHPHSYMVYNLNSDSAFTYDGGRFDGRVRHFGFADHSPPPLLLLMQICSDIASFLRQQPSNVVAIHCKAGKGRSGTIACAWLLYSHLIDSSEKAVDYYDAARVVGMRAISLPSQVRYVQYMEQIITNGPPTANIAKLRAIELTPSPASKGHISITISYEKDSHTTEVKASEASKIEISPPLSMKEDVKLELFVDRSIVFTLFFNTRMLEGTSHSYDKSSLDGERDYKGFKMLSSDFKITLHYDLTVFARNRRGSTAGRSTGPKAKTPSKEDISGPASLAAIASSANNSSFSALVSPFQPPKPPSSSGDSNTPIVPLLARQGSGSGSAISVVSKKITEEDDFPEGMVPKIERKATGYINRNQDGDVTISQNPDEDDSADPNNVVIPQPASDEE